MRRASGFCDKALIQWLMSLASMSSVWNAPSSIVRVMWLPRRVSVQVSSGQMQALNRDSYHSTVLALPVCWSSHSSPISLSVLARGGAAGIWAGRGGPPWKPPERSRFFHTCSASV